MFKQILFLILLISGTLQAQKNIECYTFKDACSGQTLSLTGSVTVYCPKFWDGKPINYDYPIIEGQVCVGEVAERCETEPVFCLNSGNWEVCEIIDNTIFVYQTLSTFPTINGTLLGYGYGTPGGTSGYAYCVGELHTGALNTIDGRTELALCPGDDVKLDYEGLDIPSNSGLCLNVNIKTADGVVISTETYNHSDVEGSTINLTSLFSHPAVGKDIYIIEFELTCCEGEATCTTNTYKYAYIEILGLFDYSPKVTAGFVPDEETFIPSTNFPGTQLPNDVIVQGLALNQITLFTESVTASEDIDIDWSLDVISCASGSIISNINAETINVSMGDNSFTTGSNLLVGSSSDCTCFQMTLSYIDKCEDMEVSDTYFFKNGPDCLQSPQDDDAKLRSSSNNDALVKVVPNPIISDLRFNVDADLIGETARISVKNVSGQLIFVENNIKLTDYTIINADIASGVYFYEIEVNSQKYSGKFVKM